VVWTGRRYLVAFATSRGASVIAVDEGGNVEPQYEVVHGDDSLRTLALATNGDNALLVTNLGGALIDGSGKKLRDIVVSGLLIDVASDGHDYMVVTALPSGVESHRVTTAGDIAPPQFVTADVSTGVAIGFGRDRYLVAWTTEDLRLLTAQLGIDGVLGPPHNAATFTSTAINVVQPRVVWRTDEFLALVGSGPLGAPQRYAVRVAEDGTPLELPSDAFADDLQPPDAAAAADGTALVATANPLAGFVLPPHMAHTLAPRPLANALLLQDGVAVASVGGDPLIAWREGTAIYLRRGSRPSVAVGTLDSAGPVGVAADGGTVWVWWLDHGSIVVRRYTEQMQPVDPAPVVAAPSSYVASGAAGGGKLLLTWPVPRALSFDYDLRCLLLEREGPVNAAPFTLASAPFAVHDPAVVWTGNDFVVGWAQSLGLYLDGLAPPGDDIDLAHVSTSGVAGVPLTIAYRQATTTNVQIAARGTELAVAWRYFGWIPSPFAGILGCVIHAGLPTPVTRWAEGAAVGELAGLIARRDDYLLVWSDAASGGSGEFQIAHRLIASDATADEIVTLPSFRSPTPVALRAGSIGTAPFLAYNRPSLEMPFGGAVRLFIRLQDQSLRRRAAR
jgi:hypothetical protein